MDVRNRIGSDRLRVTSAVRMDALHRFLQYMNGGKSRLEDRKYELQRFCSTLMGSQRSCGTLEVIQSAYVPDDRHAHAISLFYSRHNLASVEMEWIRLDDRASLVGLRAAAMSSPTGYGSSFLSRSSMKVGHGPWRQTRLPLPFSR